MAEDLDLATLWVALEAEFSQLSRATTAMTTLATSVERGMARIEQSMNRVDTAFSKAATGTNRLSSSSNKLAIDSAKVENAMQRQEAQVIRAKAALASLRQQAIDSGAKNVTAQFSQATTALATYSNQLKHSQLTSGQMAIANARLQASFSRVRTTVTSTRLMTLASGLRDLTSASVLAVGPLSGLGARISALSSIATRSSIAFAAMFGVLAGGVAAIYILSKAIFSNALAFEQIEGRLITATGSSKAAAKEFQFVAKTAQRLGTDLKSSATEYSSFRAAARKSNISLKDQKELFIGVSEAAVANRLTAEQTGGAFKALQQIMSKGTVQAEELRGQLGERIPGAFQIAARAMGLTTQELGKFLEAGKITAEDFIPKFARQMRVEFAEAAKAAAGTMTVALNKLATEWALVNLELDKTTGASKVAVAAIDTTTASLWTFEAAAKASGKAFVFYMDALTRGAYSRLTAPGDSAIFDKLKGVTQFLGEGNFSSGGPDPIAGPKGMSIGLVGLAEAAKTSTSAMKRFKIVTEGMIEASKDVVDQNAINIANYREMAGMWLPSMTAGMNALTGAHLAHLVTLKEEAETIERLRDDAANWLPTETSSMNALNGAHLAHLKTLKEESEEVDRLRRGAAGWIPSEIEGMDALTGVYRRLRAEQEMNKASAQQFASIISSSFINGVRQGKKLNEIFADMATNLAYAVAQAFLMNSIMSALGWKTNLMGGVPFPFLGGGGGGPLDTTDPIFTQSIRGPESTFAPNSSGTSSSPVVYNIDARGAAPGVGAEIQRALETAHMETVRASVEAVYQGKKRGRRI